VIRGFDAVLFAASTDDAETNRKFAESLQLTIPILSDPDKTVSAAYGVLRVGFAARHTFYIGPDGKLLYVDREVNPKTAGEDVARRLQTLGVAKSKRGGA
jgi:peroxiredoxin Q/BCP